LVPGRSLFGSMYLEPEGFYLEEKKLSPMGTAEEPFFLRMYIDLLVIG
jgi:hypothetical protein